MTMTKLGIRHENFRCNDGQEHCIYVSRRALNLQHLSEYTPLEILYRCFVPTDRFCSEVTMMGDLIISGREDKEAKNKNHPYVMVGMIYQGRVIPCNLEVSYGEIFKAPANNI